MATGDTGKDNVLPFPAGKLDPLAPFARRQPELAPPRTATMTYGVRVDLDHARPPIWRRLELASDLTLAQVHDILQAAMGWTDSHLHHFEAGPARDHQVMPFLTDFDEEEGDEGINERDVRLDQVLVEVGDRLFYEYDFGDSWDHTLTLEAVTPYDEAAPRASCVGGHRACPPENCGGVGGYQELLGAIESPGNASVWGMQLLDWLPEDFDAEKFSVAETDELIRLTLTESLAVLLPRPDDVDPNLADLVSKTGAAAPLAGLLANAGLDDEQLPDADTRARMVRPWMHLMDLVGPDGLKLTQAGHLPPAVVTELASQLDQVEPWMGKANREEHTIPVADLRASATAMGLVRKNKGRLLLTRTGSSLVADADRLWDHIRHSLPLGKGAELHCGVIALLVLAGGQEPGHGVRRHGASILENAGWRAEGGMDEWIAYRGARPTLAVLELLGCTSGGFRTGAATAEGQLFARAALRSRAS